MILYNMKSREYRVLIVTSTMYRIKTHDPMGLFRTPSFLKTEVFIKETVNQTRRDNISTKMMLLRLKKAFFSLVSYYTKDNYDFNVRKNATR